MPEARSLHSKLAQIMFEAERIPKNGTAPQVMGGYKFVQVGDAADYIRKALAEHSISMLPTAIEVLDKTEHATQKGGSMTTVDLRVTWTLTDGDTGQTAVIQSYGAGADGGDKYSGKATTSAMKYALLAGFLLSTGEDTELGDTSGKGRRSLPDSAPPVGDDIPPTDAAEETLRPLGPITREGAVAKGTGRHSDLEWRETPDGHHTGFLLEVGDGKARPQVILEGPLGAAVFATGEALLGLKVTVEGELFEVHAPKRKTMYRIVATRLATPDWTIPAEAANQTGLTPAEEAEIDELPWDAAVPA